MKVCFLDTSALVKRYVNETGSIWIQGIVEPETGNKLFVSRITWVEVLSAFSRLKRERNLSVSDTDTAIQAFRYDWDIQYHVIELDYAVVSVAGQLVQRYPLRAYDSVQLASVLSLNPMFARIAPDAFVFISADKRLTDVAQVEGLRTDNPNEH